VLAPATSAWAVYAMTEMLPVSAATLDEKLAYTGEGDCIGVPFPGVRATISDGELVLAGPNLCRGYLDERDMVAHHTGDLARIDAGGRIVLLGRKKEMIIRGHTNIYPALIEETVNQIAGVRASALVGRYDPARSDERVVLVVEPFGDESESVLRARLEWELRAGPHSIDTTAYPDAIVFAPLPRAGRSHKVDRRALAALVERLGE
jgi:acyl-CoA synthetase (AMP-forming)/AMP-acid ligase II